MKIIQARKSVRDAGVLCTSSFAPVLSMHHQPMGSYYPHLKDIFLIDQLIPSAITPMKHFEMSTLITYAILNSFN